nr:MAG TPA: hypothetical protein [Caudoviricetes sp.]
MAKHIHAKLMELYAKDAAVSDSPWKFWEVYDPEADKWVTLRKNPEWATDKLYRQKPTQLQIEGVWFPVPYGEELTVGDNYYLPELTVGEIKVVSIKCTRNTKASLERKQKDGFLFETYNKTRLYAMALKELNDKLRKLTY